MDVALGWVVRRSAAAGGRRRQAAAVAALLRSPRRVFPVSPCWLPCRGRCPEQRRRGGDAERSGASPLSVVRRRPPRALLRLARPGCATANSLVGAFFWNPSQRASRRRRGSGSTTRGRVTGAQFGGNRPGHGSGIAGGRKDAGRLRRGCRRQSWHTSGGVLGFFPPADPPLRPIPCVLAPRSTAVGHPSAIVAQDEKESHERRVVTLLVSNIIREREIIAAPACQRDEQGSSLAPGPTRKLDTRAAAEISYSFPPLAVPGYCVPRRSAPLPSVLLAHPPPLLAQSSCGSRCSPVAALQHRQQDKNEAAWASLLLVPPAPRQSLARPRWPLLRPFLSFCCRGRAAPARRARCGSAAGRTPTRGAQTVHN